MCLFKQGQVIWGCIALFSDYFLINSLFQSFFDQIKFMKFEIFLMIKTCIIIFLVGIYIVF